MSEEDIKKIAKETFIDNVMNNLDSTIIFTYIQKLEEENKQLKTCYCNRTDCGGRIKDSKKYDSVQQRIDKAIKYIEEYQYFIVDNDSKEELLEILRGNSNEKN